MEREFEYIANAENSHRRSFSCENPDAQRVQLKTGVSLLVVLPHSLKSVLGVGLHGGGDGSLDGGEKDIIVSSRLCVRQVSSSQS
jgi:hypothetical protein